MNNLIGKRVEVLGGKGYVEFNNFVNIYGVKIIDCDSYSYIGSTKNSIEFRLNEHKRYAKTGRYKNKPYEKLFLRDDIIIEIIDVVNKEERLIREEYWYNNFKNGGHCILNKNPINGWHNFSVGKLSEEHKKKIGESNKGKKHTEEAKQKIGKANSKKYIGRRLTDEHKRKISESNMGKKLSDETKNKIKNKNKNHILTISKKKKFTEEQIIEIRKLVSDGELHRVVAEKYNVTRSIITSIVNNKIYKWVDNDN